MEGKEIEGTLSKGNRNNGTNEIPHALLGNVADYSTRNNPCCVCMVILN